MPLNSINISDPGPAKGLDLVDLVSGSLHPHGSCSELYNIPKELRCTWVRENEHCFEGTTIIKYIPFLICNFTSNTLFVGIILLLLLLIVLFIVLGTVADEFFCPNLEVIAKSLNLSEATAGVTILAFGNGSPDIFTSVAGVPRGHIELIFCELIGGGIFITTVLVGTVCIRYPINVVGRILLRDVLFYLVSIVWTYYAFSKHYLTIYDTGGYLLIYGVYLLVVISDRRFRQSIVHRASQLIPESDLERLRRLHGGSRERVGSQQSLRGSRSPSKDNGEDQDPRKGDPESKGRTKKKPEKKKPESKGSVRKTPDERKAGSKGSTAKKQDEKKPGSKGSTRKKADEENATEQQNKEVTPQRSNRSITFDDNVKVSEDGERKKSKTWWEFFQTCCQGKKEDGTTQPLLDEEKAKTWLESFRSCCQGKTEGGTTTQQSHDLEKNAKKSKNLPEFFRSCWKGKKEDGTTQQSRDVEKNTQKSRNWWEYFSTCCQSKTEDETTQPLLGEPKPPPKSVWRDFLDELNPIVKEDWETSSCFFKFVLIIKSPAVLLLKLIVPVVTIHKPMRGWCKPLSVLLCITLPLYMVSAYGYATHRITKHKFPLIILFLAGGKLCSLIVFFTSRRDREPPYHLVFAFLGFLGSVFTVFTVATEVVNLMWAVGVVVGISEATLGLTVLSWGTQIGDFISIIALVRAGYERMGFVACFGGSLFNVIMSIGLAFSVATFSAADRRLEVHYGKMGLVCLTFLTLSLLSSLIAFPLMRFRTRSFFGVYLYILYAVFLTVCLLSEFDVITLPGTEEEETSHYARARPTHATTARMTSEAVVWDFR